MASSFSRAQTPKRGPGGKKCPHHFGNDVIYVCENCNVLVCEECVSKIHKRHSYKALSDVVPDIKQNMQDFIDKAQQYEIPHITQKLKTADGDLSKTRQHCQKQITKVKGQNNKLKQELDNITAKMIKSYQDMEQETSGTLLKNIKELKAQLDELNSRLHTCKDVLRSGNDVLAYDISRNKSLTFSDVQMSSLTNSLPEFTPADLSLKKLEKLFGELWTEDVKKRPRQKKNQTSAPQNKPEQNEYPNQWTVTSQYKPFKDATVSSLHPAPGNQVWMFSRYSREMLLTDHKGKVQKTLEIDATDLCLSPRDGTIWHCKNDSSVIRKVEGEESSIQFKAQKKPKCICVTNDDHIVLGHKNHLAKYTPAGQVICKTASGLLRSPVVREPRCIAECPVTRNLAVIDQDGRDYGEEKDYSYVVILDKDLQLLYTYHEVKDIYFFCPGDLCYTETGELILINDIIFNRSVMLFNEKGEYIKTLFTDNEHRSSRFEAVCELNDNTIFVSSSDTSVIVLKQK